MANITRDAASNGPSAHAVHSAANCRRATPTLWLAPSAWLEGDAASWACLQDGTYRMLSTTEGCIDCPRWEPRGEEEPPIPARMTSVICRPCHGPL